MPERTFAPGVRLSYVDVIALILAAIVAVVLGTMHLQSGVIVAFVTCHFFLFCNIFRISRVLELIWATIFIAAATSTILFAAPGWLATYSIALVVTIVVIAIETRKPSYHGIGWQRLNPHLQEWWNAREQEKRS